MPFKYLSTPFFYFFSFFLTRGKKHNKIKEKHSRKDTLMSLEDFLLDESYTQCHLCKEVSLNGINYPTVGFICNECIDRILHIRNKNTSNNDTLPKLEDAFIPTPSYIYEQLCKYVVGQDHAKKVLSVAAYNHKKRIQLNNPGLMKSNVLLIGQTGSGKTLLVNTLSNIINVPLVSLSATSLTEEGYIGNSVNKCIELLLSKSGNDIERAERGIVFIDEIDKLSETGKRDSGGYVVGRGGVQQALLTLLEGNVIEVRNDRGRNVSIDTSNIMFICAGAFSGIEDIIKKRLKSGNCIGFSADIINEHDKDFNPMEYISTDDLREYGMMGEFLGRMPSVAILDTLSINFLKKALTIPQNNILWQYKELFSYDNIQLEITDDAIEEIARTAYNEGTGCRGLRKICEKLFLQEMYELPGSSYKKVIYDKAAVLGDRPKLI